MMSALSLRRLFLFIGDVEGVLVVWFAWVACEVLPAVYWVSVLLVSSTALPSLSCRSNRISDKDSSPR